MKKLIVYFLLFSLFTFSSFAGSTVQVTGTGSSAGEAYVNAMGKAPSGNYWKIISVNKNGGNGKYYCRIVWGS